MKQNFARIGAALAALALALMPASAQLTLEEAQQLAEQNYPLVRKYDLVRQTAAYDLDNLQKGWLPQVQASAQAAYYSDVSQLPSSLTGMMASQGASLKGMAKDQYKLQLSVDQSVYDGGSIRAQKAATEAERAALESQNDVDLYAVRERVNSLFFGILLLDNRLALNADMQTLLSDNCRKLDALVRGGTAMQSDANALRAELLSTQQQRTELESTRQSYVDMLALFIGKSVEGALVKPAAQLSSTENTRPELRLFDARISAINAQRNVLNAGLRPKVSLFAQGQYGYPGYNMFESMMSHTWKLDGVVGVRASWNISRFYTDKASRRRLDTKIAEVENARDVFLFNSDLQRTQASATIARYRALIDHDAEIIALRASVRQASESKLRHGIIDVNALLQDITRENAARIDEATHEIEMLRAVYDLKNTLGQK